MIDKPRIERRAPLDDAGAWPASLHPVLRRVYAGRGVTSAVDIEHRLTGLLAPTSLGGIDRACELIDGALNENSPIVIVGDFDADGATGTAVAVRGLRLFGAQRVDYGVPNRFTHGYGLSPALVDELLARNPALRQHGLLITVDNGIAAHAGVDAARAQGMRVIVTDHHLPGETLPRADAIVNPNAIRAAGAERRADAIRLNNLAGVGVMFYLLIALRAHIRERGGFARRGLVEPDLTCLLDLVALGTVADLVALDRNNRILVEAGLKRIRAGKASAGVSALIESGKRDPARVIAADLGFVVAPRINAAGRLDDIRLGIECLLSDDAEQARRLADRLSAINVERRDLQAEMVDQAEASVQAWMARHGAQALPVGLVLFEPDWHHGVVGLVASKLKERFNRPVIACAPGEASAGGSCEHGLIQCDRCGRDRDDDLVKASGRSIAGFHLRDALAEIDARAPGLLLRFGGHAMAAGLTLRRGDVDRLAEHFDAIARERIGTDQLDAVVLSDGELDGGDFCLDLAREVRFAGPWGQAFPEPLFDGVFEVDSWRVVGETHLRLALRRAGIAGSIEAIQFGGYAGLPPPQRIRAAFQLDVNEWNGRESLQLLVRHLEPA